MTEDELDALQHLVARSLRARRSLTTDASFEREAEQHFTKNSRCSATERLEVYRVQFWLRHTASLLEDFPGVSGILGQHEWEALAESYLASHSGDGVSLRDLGQGLAAHILQCEGTPERALCHDMARLEWALIECFDAADAAPLEPSELARVPGEAWPTVRFGLAPSVRLLATSYPVAALRRALREALHDVAEGRTSEPILLPEPRDEWLLIQRDRERELRLERLSLGAYAVLRALAAGEALGPALHGVALREPQLAPTLERDVSEWFADWGRRGLFISLAW